MHTAALASLVLLLGTALLSAQGPRQQPVEPPAPTAAAGTLTAAQVEVIAKQLKDLEKQIADMRGNNLSAILAKLRSAAVNNAAALNFYLDCEKLVNVERKDLKRDEERKREANVERKAEKQADSEGDYGAAARVQVLYLILTLEAHETKAEDREKLIPKIQSYAQELISIADKLRGRPAEIADREVTRGPIVEAFQLQRYLESKDWSLQPTRIGQIWEKAIFPIFTTSEKKDGLGAQWEARINADAAYQKARLTEPEYALWVQNDLPAIQWEKATALLASGPSPVNALAEMLKHIKDHPGHPDAPQWLSQMRGAVTSAAPAAVE
jgi:hypothetical protein